MLLATIGDHSKQNMRVVEIYNITLGRDWMTSGKAISSSYHLILKFPTEQERVEVQCDQQLSYECMRIAVKGKTTPTNSRTGHK